MPGLEFANHFSEWTYNYHDAVAPQACRAELYPGPDQQRRFIKAYVDHRPQSLQAGSATRLAPFETPGGPAALAPASTSSSIIDFMLDARVPPGGWMEEEKKREEQSERRVEELMEETRLWRAANSAQWVAWGIMQAKVPGLERETADVAADVAAEEADEEAEVVSDEFDYLGYAHGRALFFWGDCVLLGLVGREELPEPLRESLTLVEF